MPIIILLFFFLSACSDDYYYDEDKAEHQKDCFSEINYNCETKKIDGKISSDCEYVEGPFEEPNESNEYLVKLFLTDYFGDKFYSEEINTNICPTEE